MLIDIEDSPKLGKTFGIKAVPDTCVIVGKENGEYVYMRPNGEVSPTRASARYIGVTSLASLSKNIDRAIVFWKSGK
jgi:hypothetical protein